MKKFILLLYVACFGNVFCQNNALSFGGNGEVELTYSSAFNFAVNDKFTIECWVKTTASYAAIIWSNHVDIAPFAGHEMAIVNGKPVMDMTENYITAAVRAEATTTVNDGNWHHLAFVYKGIPNVSGCEIYIDGVMQTLVANPNNLLVTSTSTVSNEIHIGSRDNTTYFSDITLDELRIWKRILCAAEIQAHKNCTLNGNEPQLEAYYKFNQGTASGNNATVTTLLDSSPNAHTGTLTGFSLNGTSSNWIASTASVTGACALFSASLNVSGSNTICSGMVVNLSATGALTYTWQPGNMNATSVTVSPSVSTTYTVYATSPANCLLINTYSLSVFDCTGKQELKYEYNNLVIFPNPNEGSFTLQFEQIGKKLIEISDVLGRKIGEFETENSELKIKLSDVLRGVYLVKVKTQFSEIVKKVIIE